MSWFRCNVGIGHVSESMNRKRVLNWIPGLAFIASSLVISIVFLVIAGRRDLTGLENVLFQVLTLGLGLVGSYILGKDSSLQTARNMMRPHAKSAFRRLLSLYGSLSRLAMAIQSSKATMQVSSDGYIALDKLMVIVDEQISTADDALEDWKDIIPEELEKLAVAANARREIRIANGN